MENNLKIILDEFERLKGQFVITEMNKIERLVAIGDDDEDWYYITYNGEHLHWQSCVGRIIPLKGYIREQDYNYLVNIAKLNHYDQIDKDQFNHYLELYLNNKTNHKIITDFCWDLNQ